MSRAIPNALALLSLFVLSLWFNLKPASAQDLVVEADIIFPMDGPAIENGVIVVEAGKIVAVGSADQIDVPGNVEVISAAIATPGLIDAHSVVGLGGFFNQDQDQDQLESSSPIQPALRAIDAYNGRDELVEWIRGFGVTTIHTGHGPGELVSGQTMITKTVGNTIDESLLDDSTCIAVTFSSAAQKSGSQSPGTRGKMYAMIRSELIKAQEYLAKQSDDESEGPTTRNLEMEAMASVLNGETPLLITADRSQDIANALRLADEFGIKVWLDSAAESYLLIDEIKASGIPVLIHPSMARQTGDRENASYETAATLVEAGIPVVMQSGYEGYVPKTRVVLYEAAIGAANGLTFEQALHTITLGPAQLLGIDDRVGSLSVGKDADIALYDGDPFEYTTHCTGVIIDGRVVSDEPR